MARNDGTPGEVQLSTGLIVGGKRIDSEDQASKAFLLNNTLYDVHIDPKFLGKGTKAIELRFRATHNVYHQGGGAGLTLFFPQTFYQSVWIGPHGHVGKLSIFNNTSLFWYSIILRNLPENEKT